MFLCGIQIGFVAVEKADETACYMERLAVLPEYRHCGCGAVLVKYALDYSKVEGSEKVSIGIINEQTVLKNWYKGLNFEEISTRTFPHLPFTVCFMEKRVK